MENAMNKAEREKMQLYFRNILCPDDEDKKPDIVLLIRIALPNIKKSRKLKYYHILKDSSVAKIKGMKKKKIRKLGVKKKHTKKLLYFAKHWNEFFDQLCIISYTVLSNVFEHFDQIYNEEQTND